MVFVLGFTDEDASEAHFIRRRNTGGEFFPVSSI